MVFLLRLIFSETTKPRIKFKKYDVHTLRDFKHMASLNANGQIWTSIWAASRPNQWILKASSCGYRSNLLSGSNNLILQAQKKTRLLCSWNGHPYLLKPTRHIFEIAVAAETGPQLKHKYPEFRNTKQVLATIRCEKHHREPVSTNCLPYLDHPQTLRYSWFPRWLSLLNFRIC